MAYNSKWYDYFMDILYKKYPKKGQLTQDLMDLLNIEREATYRRLRKEVQFSAHEVVKIASAWNISFDKIVGIESGEISFRMRQMNYLDPGKEELDFLRQIIQSVSVLKNFPDTEFMDICNKLPRQIVAGFEYLNQFYLFKWMYQYSTEKEVISFFDTVISEEKVKLTTEYNRAIKQVPNTNFIWDRRLFDNLINDIQYFCSIYLITKEEKELIKKDLYALLDYMLEIANNGYYPETQNKVNLYISKLNVDTNYSYVCTPEANICFVHVFEKYEIYTFNAKMVKNFMTWMQLKKRSSIQISEVDEKSRIEFFTKQRQIIDGL
jgi:hypothetical protein